MMKTTKCLMLAGIAGLGLPAAAWSDTITSVTSGTWTNTAVWSDGQAPAGTNDYQITSGNVINCPDSTSTGTFTVNFGGGSLAVLNGGALDLRKTTSGGNSTPNHTITNLAFNGASTLYLSSGAGNATRNMNSLVTLNNATLTINFRNTPGNSSTRYSNTIDLKQGLAGTGTVTLTQDGRSTYSADRNIVTVSSNGGFNGVWTLTGGTANNTWVRLVANATNALGNSTVSLNNQAKLVNNVTNGLDSVTGIALNGASSQLLLTQPWSNTVAFLATASGSYLSLGTSGNSVVGKMAIAGVGVNPGTYSETDLAALGLTTPGTGTATLEVKTLYVDNAPYFTSDPVSKPSAIQGTAYSGTLAGVAVDPDAGDKVTYTKASGPAWLQVALDGTLSGTPANADVGANSWTVRATDSFGKYADATLQISVLNANDPPTFSANPVFWTRLNAGEAVGGTLQDVASDPDVVFGDSISFSKVSGPAWLTVAASGALSGAPGTGDLGTNSFTVSATDLAGASSTTTLQIAVGPVASITSVTNGYWNVGSTWSDSNMPTNTSDYLVLNQVESPDDSDHTFGGNSMTVTNGGRLWLYRSNTGQSINAYHRIPGLTLLDGAEVRWQSSSGSLQHYLTSASVNVVGSVSFYSTGGGYANNMTIKGVVGTGTVNYTVNRNGSGQYQNVLHVTSPSPGYAGNWVVNYTYNGDDLAILSADAPFALGTGSVTLKTNSWLTSASTNGLNSLKGITLDCSSSELVLANPYVNSNGFIMTVTSATLDLGGGTSVVDSLGMNGGPLPAGTYDNSALIGLGLIPNWNNMGTLLVRHAYNAPVFTTGLIDRGSTPEDSPVNGTIAGLTTDADPGDTMTYSISSGPAWLKMAADGTLSGTPSIYNEGVNSFVVRATDSHGLYAETSLQLVVTHVNHTPYFTANPIIYGKDKDYSAVSGSLSTSATDLDLVTGAEALSFAKLSGPAWLSVAADGTVSGTPSAADNGSNVFTVAVSDLAGASNTAPMIVWVGPITTTITSVTNGLLTAGATWSDSRPPFTFNAYVIDGETVSNANAGGTYSFAGDSLTVQSGTLRLPLQSGSALTGTYNYTNFALAGGTLECAASQNSSTWNLNQPLAVNAASTLAQTGGTNTYNINLNGGLAGTGSLAFLVDRSDTTNINSTLNVYGNNTNFSGNWTVTSLDAGGGAQLVAQAVGALGSGVVTLGNGGKLSTTYYDGLASGLDSVAGILVSGTNSQLVVNGVWSGSNAFLSITTNASLDLGYNQSVVRSFATNGSPMPAGTYSANDLLALGFNVLNYGPLVVLSAYHQPAFIANPTLAADAKAGQAYSASLAGKVTDADAGDLFTFTKVSGPAWLNLAPNGTLSGTPAAGDVGNNSFIVRVMDSHGLYSDATLQVAVTALAPPVADFTGTPTSGVRPLSVTFTSTSSGSITNLVWDFGDGSAVMNTASNATPAHLYTVEGTYPVTLIAQGPGGSVTNTRAGYISVAVPGLPRVASFKASVSGLTLQGDGGPVVAGQTYYYVLHSSTNVATAKSSWPAVATNAFNLDGSFSNSIPVTPGEPKRFYYLQMP